MKKIIFILFLCLGAESMIHAQLLKSIKAKAKAAVDNSVDRSTNKLIDKAINNPVDNTTDTVLAKSGRKVNSVFKKKNKEGSDSAQTSASDSTVIKPVSTDSSATVTRGPDSNAVKPVNQNLVAQIRIMQYKAFIAKNHEENTPPDSHRLFVDGNRPVAINSKQERIFRQGSALIDKKPDTHRYG